MGNEKLDGLYFDFACNVLNDFFVKFNTGFNYSYKEQMVSTGDLSAEMYNNILSYFTEPANSFFQGTCFEKPQGNKKNFVFDLKKLAENLQEFTKNSLESLECFLEDNGISILPDTSLQLITTRCYAPDRINRVFDLIQKDPFFPNPDNIKKENADGSVYFAFNLLEIAQNIAQHQEISHPISFHP